MRSILRDDFKWDRLSVVEEASGHFEIEQKPRVDYSRVTGRVASAVACLSFKKWTDRSIRLTERSSLKSTRHMKSRATLLDFGLRYAREPNLDSRSLR